MAAITVRNLSAETHRALKARAVDHGRSTEAEVRNILETAVIPRNSGDLVAALMAMGREAELTDEDVDLIQNMRDKTPHVPIDFD